MRNIDSKSRPRTQFRFKYLAVRIRLLRLGGSLTTFSTVSVISGHLQCKRACPLYPRKRTCAVQNKCLLRGRTKPCHSPTRGRLSKGAAAIISFRTFDASDTSPVERIEHATIKPAGHMLGDRADSGWHDRLSDAAADGRGQHWTVQLRDARQKYSPR